METTEVDEYENSLRFVSVIAQPMASAKLTKKVYKLIKKASAHKTHVKSGLKDVQRAIRKGERGMVIFAGDVSPVEIMCHLPAVCEEFDMPYIYVPSREALGTALGLRRGSLMVLIQEHKDYKELYDKMAKTIKNMPVPW
uniref:H/ACA ribonucleoprotein complex subunit 2 n=1 Tax=Orthoderella ornata TaxID=444751 RepID=A0A481SXS5_9NEOP|nr:putative NHP2 protein [Orthoderella ornata]